MPILKPRNCLAVLLLTCAGFAAAAATPPYIQLVPAPVAPASCASTGPTPSFAVNMDLGASGTYRYSPAYVVPYFFDDEGEFNIVWNQDATLYVSAYAHEDGPRVRWPLPMAPLATWYGAFGRLPEHTELARRTTARGTPLPHRA
jgi:hypothetical protein